MDILKNLNLKSVEKIVTKITYNYYKLDFLNKSYYLIIATGINPIKEHTVKYYLKVDGDIVLKTCYESEILNYFENESDVNDTSFKNDTNLSIETTIIIYPFKKKSNKTYTAYDKVGVKFSCDSWNIMQDYLNKYNKRGI